MTPELANQDLFQDKAKKSQSDLILELALSNDITLFTDQYNNPHIKFPEKPRDIYKTYPLSSGIVRDWLSKLLWDNFQKAPGSEATSSALAILRAKAREGPCFELHNRIAQDIHGNILIDMANEGWNYIRVSKQGWSIEGTGCPLFRRYSHQKELPAPKEKGNPWDILQFANINDEKHQLLYVVSTISYLIPDIQHPVSVFYGPHGSGKSVAMRAQRATVDPSIVELLAMPRSDRELVQQLYHHYCGFYDNISTISNRASDIFCRAVTGTGNTKRQLYSDDDDIIYEYRRCIGLNGINIAAQRGDLLDRAIIYECQMMENSHRLEEKKITKLIEELTPSILGSVLDTIVKAMNIYPTVQLEKLYRMADFTRWGCAISQALGIDQLVFLDAYEDNIRSQSEETLKASLIATVLVAWMDLYPEGVWRGAPSALYDELCEYAEELNVSTRQKSWPKSAHWMMRRLADVEPSLLSTGYSIEKDRTSKTRIVTIRKTLGNTVNAVTSVTDNDSNDVKDATLESYSNIINISDVTGIEE